MERLRECVDVIRALWRGEEVSHRGHVVVDRARLWSLPDEPPQLVAGAMSAETAAWAAEWADGLITANQPADKLRRIVDAYRSAGGRGTLRLQVHLAYADSDDEALAVAVDQWRGNCVPTLLAWDLTTPEQFEARRGTSRRRRSPPTFGSPPTSDGTWGGCRSMSILGSRSCTCITSGNTMRPSSTPSAPRFCLPFEVRCESDPDRRSVVEDGRRLLPGCADLLRFQR